MATPEPPPVVIIAPPPPERAPDFRVQSDEERQRAEAETKLENGALELSLGTLSFQPALAGASFSGSGKAVSTQLTQSFNQRGRELGLDAPFMWGGDVSIRYMRRYLAVGFLGFIAGHPGAADAAIPPTARSLPAVNPGALTGWGGAIDLAGALPFGIVTFRPGVVIGLRGFSMPITGFEQTTCHSKNGTYKCDETADTAALGFIEPRLRVIFTPGRSALGFGAYVGTDVLNGGGPSAGLFISFATRPHERLVP